MEAVAVGVDMAKASFVAAVCMAGQVRELGEQANDLSGFVALHNRLAALQGEDRQDVIHLVVEPTGGYEQALVAFAYAQGWQVSLPNPKQVRDWAKGIGQRTKTDRQDAMLLARYAAGPSGLPKPAPQQPPPVEVSKLDSLLKRRQELEQMLHQERMRHQSLSQRPGIAEAVLANLQRVIEALEAALAEVEQAIEQQMRQHGHLSRERQRLLALPREPSGRGPKNVLPLIVLLYRWQALTNGTGDAKGLTAFVGLDPQRHESGRSVHRPATISKMGDGEVRRLLYMGALGGVRGHNPLRCFYQRLRGRGKPAKVALVAAAHKILVWAWTLFSRQTTWDPAYASAAT